MALVIPVDIEALVHDYLVAQADVGALVADRIYTRIPEAAKWPLIRLTRIGGLPRTLEPLWLDAPVLQVDAWGPLEDDGKVKAQDLGATARAALDAMSDVDHALGVVTGVETIADLQWAPDPETDRPRYLFRVQVFVHPLAS